MKRRAKPDHKKAIKHQPNCQGEANAEEEEFSDLISRIRQAHEPEDKPDLWDEFNFTGDALTSKINSSCSRPEDILLMMGRMLEICQMQFAIYSRSKSKKDKKRIDNFFWNVWVCADLMYDEAID